MPEIISQAVRASGFGGEFTVVVKLFPDGRIAKVEISALDFPETEGYGTRCLEESFLSRFTGLSSSKEVLGVDGVTGATVTSNAIKNAVSQAVRD
ncbi:FMN-binding protein [bacterium]|nr:FMN-binding protein [bacterium]